MAALRRGDPNRQTPRLGTLLLSRGLYYGLLGRVRGGFAAQVRRAFMQRQHLQWDDPQQVAQRQLEKLNALLAHACRNVPYYRRLHAQGLLPDRLADASELAVAPVLTKSIILQEPQAFLAQNIDRAALLPRRSGGSTGQTLNFFITVESVLAAQAGELWGDSLAGYRLGDAVAVLWGSHFDSPPRLSLPQRLAQYLRNRLMLISDRLDEASMDELLEACRRHRPDVLIGYVVALGALAGRLLQTGRRVDWPAKGIITAAEPLSPAKRQSIQQAFGRDVFNRYGTREVGLVAMECDAHQGLHLDCENIYVDLASCPEMPGMSRILATRLSELGMPLIRYDLGDYTVRLSSPKPGGEFGRCTCGRGYPTIQEVRGRVISALRTRRGSTIAGEVFIAMLDFQPVRRYRVVQEADYSVRVEVVPTEAYGPADEAKILGHVRNIVGPELPVRVEVRKQIELTASGKLLPVVSHVQEPAQGAAQRAATPPLEGQRP